MPKWLKIYLSGVLMGAADIVPGVSGGTIAFIVGIYDRLIAALSGVNKDSIMMLFKGQFKALWQHFDGTFLVILLAGIATSIFSIASLMTELMHTYPVWLWSFFFGLILASAVVLILAIPKFHARHLGMLVIGVLIGASLSMLVPTQVGINWLMVFCAGMIAICAMILPGISGSFILLMLGMYGYVIGAIKDLNLAVIVIFAMGALLGLLSFSKLLHWLLQHAKQVTLALLTGIMLGALTKVWPWKEALSVIEVRGKTIPSEEALLLPWQMANYHWLQDLLIPCLLIALGAGIVLGAHYISLQKTDANNK
ncbi:DUF368 domain-containing protein [Marinomonas ostreistagni]|uniref:DUF368 domain-containing protein n=1 Tax=Marinomonas ostreistagni TaxID=359209 RepID=UPI0019515084|nr:DUF368 domain-containing protein [Marinomonas ostreistagni]MBM6551339.1 DUF368 domain-containing protein [Marinomonas ostreistagni]